MVAGPSVRRPGRWAPSSGETTLSPLARQVGMLDDLPLQALPSRGGDGAGGLRLGYRDPTGERLLMYSSQEGLLQRSLNAGEYRA